MSEHMPAAETATLVCGYVGGVTLAICLVPQLIVMWRRRSADDVSLPWLILYCIGLALSLAYVVYIAALAAYIPMALELLLTLGTLFSKVYLDRYGVSAVAAAADGNADDKQDLDKVNASAHGRESAVGEGSHHARVSLAIGRLSSAIPRAPPCPHCGGHGRDVSKHGPRVDRSGSGRGPRSSLTPKLLHQQQQALSDAAAAAAEGGCAIGSLGTAANGSAHGGAPGGPGVALGMTADGMHARHPAGRPVGLYDVQLQQS